MNFKEYVGNSLNENTKAIKGHLDQSQMHLEKAMKSASYLKDKRLNKTISKMIKGLEETMFELSHGEFDD